MVMAVDMLCVGVPGTRKLLTSQAGDIREAAYSIRGAHIAQAAGTMQPADTVGLAELMSRGGTAVIMAVGDAAITAATVGQVTVITAWAIAIHTMAITVTHIIPTVMDTRRT